MGDINVPYSHERASMGGAPYKSAKDVLLSVSAFNHERAPMSCLQQLDALEANNCNVQQNHLQQLETKS